MFLSLVSTFCDFKYLEFYLWYQLNSLDKIGFINILIIQLLRGVCWAPVQRKIEKVEHELSSVLINNQTQMMTEKE